MPKSLISVLLIAALFVACCQEAPGPTEQTGEAAWGEPDGGLQLRLTFERTAFKEGDELTTVVAARNVGDAHLVLHNFDLDWWHRLTLTNTADGTRWLGGAGLFIDVEKPLDVTLGPGETWERTAILNDGKRRFLRLIENRQPGDDWDYRDALPPGRYRVSIEYEPGTGDAAYGPGTPTSNEVEITIGE